MKSSLRWATEIIISAKFPFLDFKSFYTICAFLSEDYAFVQSFTRLFHSLICARLRINIHDNKSKVTKVIIDLLN